MGCDIHIFAERKNGDSYEPIIGSFSKGAAPFDWRAYGMFAFLAGVRNYSDIPALSDARGLPSDLSPKVRDEYNDWWPDAHSSSWLSVDELSSFNYDAPVEDRRTTVRTSYGFDGGATAKPGGGEMTTYREFLGEAFFKDIKQLRDIGADRVVFWFDN